MTDFNYELTPAIMRHAASLLRVGTYDHKYPGFVCHAVAAAFFVARGTEEPEEHGTKWKSCDIVEANILIHPLLYRDGISVNGACTDYTGPEGSAARWRSDRIKWCLKIAEELGNA